MPGGLMQLVAYGAQDIYLTGNPQITFFKVVYRRHTNFSIETVEGSFVGNAGFGNRLTTKIPRIGDLMHKIYLRIVINSVDPLNSNFAWVRRLGHAILSESVIKIGGGVIDRQYGIWLNIWYELARKGDHEVGYANMIGDVPELTKYDSSVKPDYILYVPLQFWFNKFVGLAVPLIALQYHQTELEITLETVDKLVVTDNTFDLSTLSINDITVLIDYIYLDTEERRRFALVGHEYLIEQLQFSGINTLQTSPVNYILDFNHPVKELFWVVKNGNFNSRKEFIYYTHEVEWNLEEASIVILDGSISVGTDPRPLLVDSVDWVEIPENSSASVGIENIINITNNYNMPVYVNPNSIYYGTYGITNKISGDVVIDLNGNKSYNNIITRLTIRDISIPIELATDNRYGQNNPLINMPHNYGIYIDGSINPFDTVLLQFNGNNRFDEREGDYFNYVQPIDHHTNTPVDGVNCYSFALYPEQHQPSGTANFSRIESSNLILTYGAKILSTDLPNLDYINDLNELYVFCSNYNILRFLSGMGGIAYGSTS